MTSSEIRQSFLDFFKSKQHTIVPSSSLLPDAPNLLFTNAGMNQFVPIFLGQQKSPYNPPRAADTQKCIRAGGKHNDLEDVGLDTYHHTFFEMLGNWSFGDYFKKEAIEWAWELVTGIWKFPKERLYATVYNPDKSKGDPSELDQEAYDHWARLFTAAGLDPKVHIVYGGKKDNFWMMGETGPCGPCSEIHVDLTSTGDTKGSLVNKGDARCIEIWNLVFIQFNANPDGTFSPLPARHVDTGMGFERVTSIIQGTKNFSDFKNAKISNYETDIFRPLFTKIEQLSGKRYTSTLPKPGSTGDAEQEKIDIAFRVIADHIRTLSFAISDGIQPGNTDRNYVLRRILRRAVRYGRTLGFHEPFFYKLVGVLIETMGHVFSEIRENQKHVEDVIRVEEEAFNKTLDEGIHLFEEFISLDREAQGFYAFANPLLQKLKANKEIQECLNNHQQGIHDSADGNEWRSGKRKETHKLIRDTVHAIREKLPRNFELWKRVATEQEAEMEIAIGPLAQLTNDILGPLDLESLDFIPDQLMPAVSTIESGLHAIESLRGKFRGKAAFLLFDTYGFPLDLTELMARERGLAVDVAGFNKLMEEQRERARKAQKREVVTISGTARITFQATGTLSATYTTHFV
ncbi:MAG TPA: alanine--tRNA ligase, partial [Candidatus Binatia bacterium]|nr:alanine--tRNA ligase [Candidatus Binatia bacterium]